MNVSYRNFISKLKSTDYIVKIIYILIFIFLLSFLNKPFFVNTFALDSNLKSIAIKPWTLISYSFIHDSFLHLLSNVIVLYFVGKLFLDYFSEKQFLYCYFLGVLVAGILFLSHNITGNLEEIKRPLGGASAGITSIFIALVTRIPNYKINLRIFGHIKLWALGSIWVLLNFIQINSNMPGGYIAHLGGALVGYIYARELNKGKDIALDIEELYKKIILKFTKNKLTTVYKSESKINSTKPKSSRLNQKRINCIIEKISNSGYESLSKEEKETLFKSGKNSS